MLICFYIQKLQFQPSVTLWCVMFQMRRCMFQKGSCSRSINTHCKGIDKQFCHWIWNIVHPGTMLVKCSLNFNLWSYARILDLAIGHGLHLIVSCNRAFDALQWILSYFSIGYLFRKLIINWWKHATNFVVPEITNKTRGERKGNGRDTSWLMTVITCQLYILFLKIKIVFSYR